MITRGSVVIVEDGRQAQVIEPISGQKARVRFEDGSEERAWVKEIVRLGEEPSSSAPFENAATP